MSAKIQQAINALRQGLPHFLELLSEHPDLQHNFAVTYKRMTNGLCVAAGLPIEDVHQVEATKVEVSGKALTHIAGIPISSAKATPAQAVPSKEERDDFEHMVEQAFGEVLTSPVNDFLEKWPEPVVRGVALRAGFPLMDIEELRVNSSFVKMIQGRLNGQAAEDAAVKQAEAATEQIKAQATGSASTDDAVKAAEQATEQIKQQAETKQAEAATEGEEKQSASRKKAK